MKMSTWGVCVAAVWAVCAAGCGNSDLRRGDEALANQDFDGAIAAYQAVLSREPDNVDLRYRLVDAYVKQMSVARSTGHVPLPELESAVAAVHAIVEPVRATEPRLSEALVQLHLSLARNYDDANLPERARDEWRVIADLKPGASAYFNVGHASMALGEWEEAIGAFRKALEQDAYMVDAYKGLGNAMIQLRQDAEAAKAYKQALDIEPLDQGVRFNLGVALMRSGSVDEAIAEFEKVIEQDPTYPLAYRGMRNALERKGDLEAAREWDQRFRDVAGLASGSEAAEAADAMAADAADGGADAVSPAAQSDPAVEAGSTPAPEGIEGEAS